ncbi:FtsX-like permease family protein [Kitasatospora sp. NBC_01287]|uniref:FtsX-like permease family protein n=1 Tax=Kitasatospora sp. NBC_01287 TaxID=2903573 RepID=UPI002258FB8D|nr:FtsX-like permease family protein [Kitasatospora sp. NBC_01287]MCX4746877.1 FtsX-like permease family protein [Kitasatospora sp. NBC_01287]
MRWVSWRVALRIARRDALRAKGRSLLVLAMIALPILGVTGVDVTYRSSNLTAAEQADRQLGRADLLLESHMRGGTVSQAPFAGDGENDSPAGRQPTEQQRRSLGTDPAQLAAQLLPPGSVLTPVAGDQRIWATSVPGRLQVTATEADLTDQVWRGKLNLIRGKAPVDDQQIAVTQRFLDGSGLKVGGTTKLAGVGDAPFTITGVVEYPDELGLTAVVTRPGVLSQGQPQAAQAADGWLVRLPAGTTVDWAKVQELNQYGFAATSRSVVLHPPARAQVPYYVAQDNASHGSYFNKTAVVMLVTVAGMALLEIVLLAGPAFAVGARRSRRQLGLLAAAGGDRAQVRAVVLGGGVLLGVAGAVTGVVLAVLLVALTRQWTEPLAGRRLGALRLMPLDLLGIVAIGLVTGLLAALVPAVQASRQDVVAALTGRGAVKPPSKKLTLLGLLMLAGGAGLALLGATRGMGSRSSAVLGGSMIAELGMVACTPMVVGLFGKLGRWLPLGPRLALRDSVRHRGRTAPAVAAVMAAVAGAVAVGIYSASADEEGRQSYTPAGPGGSVSLSVFSTSRGGVDAATARGAVERAVSTIGPRADVSALRYPAGCDEAAGHCGYAMAVASPAVRCPLDDGQYHDGTERQQSFSDPRCLTDQFAPGRFGSVVVGDANLLHNLFDLSGGAAQQAVADGKAVVFDPRMIQDGKAFIRLQDPYQDGQDPSKAPPSHEVTVDAVLAPVSAAPAQMLMPPQTAARLGLQLTDSGSIWRPTTALSSADEQRASAALVNAGGGNANLYVERGYHPAHSLVGLGLTGFAILVALGAAGIATGLAAADSQQDLATLAAVGAAPRIRRSLSGFQCGVIAAMGAVLGTVCGMVPAVALRRIEGMADSPLAHSHTVIAFPWLNIALTLVVLPLLAGLLAGALTRSRVTLLRRAA